MRIALLTLRDGDREKLVSLTRSSTVMAASAQRALVVLLAADGGVEHWDRCADRGVAADNGRVAGPLRAVGMAGFVDRPRSGRPRESRTSTRLWAA
jgi:hypothetical protein